MAGVRVVESRTQIEDGAINKSKEEPAVRRVEQVLSRRLRKRDTARKLGLTLCRTCIQPTAVYLNALIFRTKLIL